MMPPLASVIVPEIHKGRRTPVSSNAASMAKSAAFPFNVSKMVSTMRTSAPPSINPSAASL